MKAVIFDVDGTLYSQKKLRMRMVFDMVWAVMRNPGIFAELKIIRDFRREREKKCSADTRDIDNQQYLWGARASGVPPEMVRKTVQKWMFDRPLNYLARCRYRGLTDFFAYLKSNDVRIATFSDYPSERKLAVLELDADIQICAADPDVDRLKPDPRGLFRASERLNVPISDCLMIGDRDDKDGECARRAGVPYIIIEANAPNYYCRPETYAKIDAWKKKRDIRI